MAPGTWTPTKRRGPIAAEFQTPGPAAINLSTSFGSTAGNKNRSPAFTITGRNDNKPNTAGPGPGQYNINGLSHKGKEDAHAPSMHVKIKDPKPFVTPSPGDYCPEKSFKVLEPSHKFSFGVKAEPGKEFDIPAPNSYNIPDIIGAVKGVGPHHTSPSFTMGGRFQPEEDKMRVPGPGTYNDAAVDHYKALKSPAFSMGQRTLIPSDHTMKPGPGAHCPEKYIDSGPKFTLSARLKEFRKFNTPGPGRYEVVAVDNYCHIKQPAFTMSPKTELPVDKTIKPAPNAYSPDKYPQDNGPKYSMSPRLEEINKIIVPGPGSYETVDVDKCREKQPIYSMAPKTELPHDKTAKPAPNAYCPEKNSSKDAPKFSFGIRHSAYLGKLRDQ